MKTGTAALTSVMVHARMVVNIGIITVIQVVAAPVVNVSTLHMTLTPAPPDARPAWALVTGTLEVRTVTVGQQATVQQNAARMILVRT